MQFGFDKVLEMIRQDLGERAYRIALVVVYGGLIFFVLYGAGLAWTTTLSPLAVVIGSVLTEGWGVLSTQDLVAQVLALLSSGLVLLVVVFASQGILWLWSIRRIQQVRDMAMLDSLALLSTPLTPGAQEPPATIGTADTDKGRLLSSLSALRSEGEYFKMDIQKWTEKESEWKWGFIDGVTMEWFRSIKRVLESWDEKDKSELFGLSGASLGPISISVEPVEERKRVVVERIDLLLTRVDALMSDIQKSLSVN